MFYDWEDSDIQNYAGDNTIYTYAPDTDTVISKLQSTSLNLFTCLWNNDIKAKPEKCHLLLSSKTQTESLFEGSSIKSRANKTLPWALNFDLMSLFHSYVPR